MNQELVNAFWMCALAVIVMQEVADVVWGMIADMADHVERVDPAHLRPHAREVWSRRKAAQ
jgi:hypothetical protein